jgi:UDP-N-acetylglucosamine--N-acetylmuramyl-(pentapeptide) pyrophosphoryl-undecaprenol N-acetylglucosamine transferase
VVGNPLRREIKKPITAGAFEFLKLEPNVPIIFVVGGSQGSVKINEIILDILPKLLEKYQIIHQTGKKNFDDISLRASFLLKANPLEKRYKPFAYLNDLAMKMTAGVAQLIISRAGSAIFEFALWGIPALIIPISEDVSHDQRTNAFTYARAGACVVIEENNLTPSILQAEIERLMNDSDELQKMGQAAKTFARPEAAALIAEEIIKIGLEHEE